MDETKLNIMFAEVQLRARALVLAIRGHASTSTEGDAEVLETLARYGVRDLDDLREEMKRVTQEADGTYTVVLTACGPQKIEVIKGVRAFTGLGLKETKDLVEAAPTIIK